MDSVRERELWFLKLLLPGFGDPSRSTNKALQSSGFGKLPPELIQQITDYLPMTSAAAFSVTCHTFHLILGNQYVQALEQRILDCRFCDPTKLILQKQYFQALKALRRDDLIVERRKFLLMLAHEMPSHIARYIGIMDCVNAPWRPPCCVVSSLDDY